MEHIVIAQFDGYTLRSVTEDDYPRLEAWIQADRFHNGTMDPEFFMGQAIDENGTLAPDPRASCYALEDPKGTIFYIRLSRASRVNIQFEPTKSMARRTRVAVALLKGMAFLEVALARAGCEEWIFETEDRGLANMARKHMAFVDSPNEMVREISHRTTAEAEEEAELHDEQSNTTGVQ